MVSSPPAGVFVLRRPRFPLPMDPQRSGQPSRPRVPVHTVPRRLVRRTRAAADRALARRRLRRASARNELVIAGPWLSEIGFEVLYWIPLLRRVLREHDVAAERAVALTRGGAGAWYHGICDQSLDVLSLLSPAELRAGQRRRVAELGAQKQIAPTTLERRLLASARARLGATESTLVHPALMYTRLNAYWWGGRPVSFVRGRAEYARLPEPPPLPEAAALALPPDYVAVKAYFSDAFPASSGNRAFVRELVAALAARTHVVLLAPPFALDDHENVEIAAQGAVIDAGPWMSPADNLAVQSRIVAGANGLVTTYGGFSYLGPFLGVDTVSFFSGYHNPRHLELMHAVQGELGATLDARPLEKLHPIEVAEHMAGTESAAR
jgi:hypothetical protein